jgi:hypothetical protein
MTPGAWIMLVAVWLLIIFFAGYFLWRVFTVPQSDNNQDTQP